MRHLAKLLQIVALENDLEASVEYSELLEKRFTEESENNTSLQLRVETLDSQVCGLEDNLKTSLSQIKEMNSKVVLMDEEIRQTGFVLCEKEKEISRLSEELKRNDEKLKKSTIQAESYKTAHEDILKCKKETENQLEQTELLLKRSEKLLHQEKQLTNDFTTEKDHIEKELQSTITKLQERVDVLMSELSATMTNEQTTKENLDSARDTIKQLENEVNEQLLKMKECEGNQKTKEEELDNLKGNYTSTKAELDKTRKENEELHGDNRELQEVVERLEAKITLHNQGNEHKLKEIENLEIQFSGEKKAKEILQSAISTLQKDLDFFKKQNSEKKKQIECILENKTAEVEKISKNLVEEINKAEELQSNLNAMRSEKKKLEQRNGDISQEIFTSCQSLIKDLESSEFGKSCDDSLLEEGSDSVTDLSEIRGMVCSSHTLVKDQINHLNTKLSELNERLKETGKQNETLLVEKTQLEDDLHRVQKESDAIQVDRNSLVKTFETSQHYLELKSSKIQTLEDEINEFRQREKCLHETTKAKEEEYLVLHTKMEVIEKTKESLEEEVDTLQLKVGNTIIELTTAKTTNEVLESKNSELIFTNSRLLDDQASLQNKLNEAEKETKELLENLSLKENEISRLKTETYATEKGRIATEKCLEQRENELSHLQDNLNELERKKYDLENEMDKLREFSKQIEKDHEDLQQTNSQIQADNYQLRRELECEQTEKLTEATRLQCQLEKALTSLEKQHCKLCHVQNEKDIVQNQLLEAEKELTVLMEDNANLKHQMYQSKTTDKDELLKIRYQVYIELQLINFCYNKAFRSCYKQW
jgi:chromosome segregation ATPase